MAKSKTVHTLESLHAMSEEIGDCWEWGRYYANGVPYVYQGGKMMSVRKLVSELSGGKHKAKNLQFGTTCGNPKCVNPEHVVGRTVEQHMRHMGFAGAGNVLRAAKIQRSWAGRTKLTQEQVDEIRGSDEAARELGKRFGVGKTYISKIRDGSVWRRLAGPWSGLY